MSRRKLFDEVCRVLKIGGRILSEQDTSHCSEYFTAFLQAQLGKDDRFIVKQHVFDDRSYSGQTEAFFASLLKQYGEQALAVYEAIKRR